MKKIFSLLLALACSVGMWAQRVSLDFTNAAKDWGMPTSYVQNEEHNYTNGDYQITIKGQPSASNGFKAQSGYIIMGKSGAYLTLPAMDFSVGKIVLGGNSGASSSVQFNIYEGTTAVSTAVTGCTSDNTFIIDASHRTAGTVYTIKVTSAANLQITRVDFYEPSSDPVPVTSVSLDESSITLTEGFSQTLTATVAPTNADNKNVSWESSDEEVATVENGIVTAVAAGNAVITVKTEDGNKTATCNVTVKAPVLSASRYEKVTSNLTDWSGKYLFVYEADGVALDAALGSGIDKASNTVSVTINNGVINGSNIIDAAAVVVEAVDGGYSLKVGTVYMGISSYGNGLKVNATTPYVNSIAYSTTNSRAEISQAFGASGTMYLCFNSNASDKRFRYYKEHSQKNIQLYKLVESDEVTISAAGYATYFNAVNAVELPAGVEGYVFFNGAIEKIYEAEDVVPAGEPLVLKAAQGKYTLNYTTSEDESYKEQGLNDLQGAATAMTATAMAAANPDAAKFYALSLNAAGEASSVGFYWVAEGGAAFAIGAGKAYLALPSSAAPARFLFNETTALENKALNVEVKKVVVNGQMMILRGGNMFDLNGRIVK